MLTSWPIHSHSATQEVISHTQAPLKLVLLSEAEGTAEFRDNTYPRTQNFPDAHCVRGQVKGLWRTEVSQCQTSKKQSTT